MTNETLRQNAVAMQALAEGKPIEYRDAGCASDAGWKEYKLGYHRLPDFQCWQYRAKPEPVSRPWSKPEDVPGPVCWIRGTGWPACSMVVGIQPKGMVCAYSENSMRAVLWSTLEGFEYSTDRREWKPCTTEEP